MMTMMSSRQEVLGSAHVEAMNLEMAVAHMVLAKPESNRHKRGKVM